MTFQVRKKEKSAVEINLFNFKQTLSGSQLKSGKMKNYLIYIFALLTIVFSSCAVNEELVMLDEVDDLYIQPDDNFFASASASISDDQPIQEPMSDASNAEMSYYQNTPYSSDSQESPEPKSSNESSDEEYYDYYDEDYAGRLQNFHGVEDNEYHMYGGNSMYNNRTLPPTASWPRFNWSMNYGFSSFGYGARSGFGLGVGFGNSMMCNGFNDPFYNPWFDPFYSPYCDPYMNPWFRPGWNTGWGMGMNYGWGRNNWGWGNPYMYNPYMYGYGQGFVDGSSNNNFNYNNQPPSGRRSRGGIVNSGNTGSGSDTEIGGGAERNTNTETRQARQRSATRVSENGRSERIPRSESVSNRETRSRGTRPTYDSRNNVRSSRYIRTDQNNSNNFSRSRVAPYTRERSTRSRTTRSNSLYNNTSRPRMNRNDSYYSSPSRSRSSSPSYSSPSRSRSTSSPSRSTGTRRR